MGTGKDRTPPNQKQVDDQNPSATKNGKNRDRRRKDQVDIHKGQREPYAEVRKLEETDSVTVSIKKHYKIPISIALTTSRMRHVNCGCVNGAGSNLLREDLVEPD